MGPWVWFVIAGLAAVLGAVLLAADHGRRTAHQRERRRWAALRGWRFVASDPVLADRWRHGVIARGGPGMAKDLVVGSLFTPHGRRPVQVFDHEQGGKVTCVVVAVQRRFHAANLVAELWLPDRPFPQDPGLELFGPFGGRYAFVTDPERLRPLVTAEVIAAADELGQHVPVAWLEQDWLVAAAPSAATPAELERLLSALDTLADQLDSAAGAEASRVEAARVEAARVEAARVEDAKAEAARATPGAPGADQPGRADG